MASLAIPEFRDEGSGGNAGASRTRRGEKSCLRQTIQKIGWIGKERNAGESFLVVRPIPI